MGRRLLLKQAAYTEFNFAALLWSLVAPAPKHIRIYLACKLYMARICSALIAPDLIISNIL